MEGTCGLCACLIHLSCQLSYRAREIFSKFLCSKATTPVNIDSQAQLADDTLSTPHPDMFKEQQLQVPPRLCFLQGLWPGLGAETQVPDPELMAREVGRGGACLPTGSCDSSPQHLGAQGVTDKQLLGAVSWRPLRTCVSAWA